MQQLEIQYYKEYYIVWEYNEGLRRHINSTLKGKNLILCGGGEGRERERKYQQKHVKQLGDSTIYVSTIVCDNRSVHRLLGGGANFKYFEEAEGVWGRGRILGKS